MPIIQPGDIITMGSSNLVLVAQWNCTDLSQTCGGQTAYDYLYTHSGFISTYDEMVMYYGPDFATTGHISFTSYCPGMAGICKRITDSVSGLSYRIRWL